MDCIRCNMYTYIYIYIYICYIYIYIYIWNERNSYIIGRASGRRRRIILAELYNVYKPAEFTY